MVKSYYSIRFVMQISGTKYRLCQSLFLIKLQAWDLQLYQIRDSDAGIFLWILRNFSEHLLYRTPSIDCFWNIIWKNNMRWLNPNSFCILVFFLLINKVTALSCRVFFLVCMTISNHHIWMCSAKLFFSGPILDLCWVRLSHPI